MHMYSYKQNVFHTKPTFNTVHFDANPLTCSWGEKKDWKILNYAFYFLTYIVCTHAWQWRCYSKLCQNVSFNFYSWLFCQKTGVTVAQSSVKKCMSTHCSFAICCSLKARPHQPVVLSHVDDIHLERVMWPNVWPFCPGQQEQQILRALPFSKEKMKFFIQHQNSFESQKKKWV